MKMIVADCSFDMGGMPFFSKHIFAPPLQSYFSTRPRCPAPHLLQEKLLGIEIVGMGLIMASIYMLNKVTVNLKTASETKKKPQHPSAIISKGKKPSGFALRAILSILRP